LIKFGSLFLLLTHVTQIANLGPQELFLAVLFEFSDTQYQQAEIKDPVITKRHPNSKDLSYTALGTMRLA